MKTATFSSPQHHFIDLAPLSARYEVLTHAVLTYLAAGQLGLMLRYSRKVLRLVQVFTKLEAQNILLTRKREMLSHAPWRERVLKELGGLRRLKMWETARARVLALGDAPAVTPKPSEPSWLYTPERRAESERLKAHARKCARAGAHPNIYRDRVKMDFDGLFRLPPLPRDKTGMRQVKVYTKNSIVNYDFNGMPFGEVKGFGPAMVWPVEFYAAMGLEVEHDINKGCHTVANSVCPVPMPESAPKDQDGIQPQLYSMGSGLSLASQTQGRNDNLAFDALPLRFAMNRKTYNFIFENPV